MNSSTWLKGIYKVTIVDHVISDNGQITINKSWTNTCQIEMQEYQIARQIVFTTMYLYMYPGG